jgi:hypothetical protein
MGQPLDKRRQEETDITNKSHPREKSDNPHIWSKICISGQNTIILPGIIMSLL